MIYIYIYALAIWTLFIIRIILECSGEINEWAAVWYVMSYKDGAGSRLLIGSLIDFFVPGDFVSEGMIMAILLASYIIIALLVAVLLSKYLHKYYNEFQDENSKKYRLSALLFTGIYLSMPTNISFLWTTENVGRIEGFVIIFLLISVLLFSKIKNVCVKYIVLSLTSVICIATYQAFVFLYFPIIFCMVICDLYKADKQDKIKSLIGIMAVCLCTFFAFVFFQFFTSVKYADVDEMTMVIQQRTDMEVDASAVWCEFFSDVKTSWIYFFEPMINDEPRNYFSSLRERGYVNLVFLLPITIILVYVWRKLFIYDEIKDFKSMFKSKYFWIVLGDLVILLEFMITMDWGRWFAALYSVQLFEIMYLGYTDDVLMKKVMKSLGEYIDKHKVLFAIMIIYLCMLSPMQAGYQSDDSTKIVRYIYKLFIVG